MPRAYNYSSLKAFMKRVRVSENGCHEWTGNVNRYGYGMFYVSAIGKMRAAHRWFYEYQHGLIEGMDLDHLCRNRKCVNLNHLEVVTRRVNLLRGETIPARNVQKEKCPKGHELSPYRKIKTRTHPRRHCPECARISAHRYWEKIGRERYHAKKSRQAELIQRSCS